MKKIATYRNYSYYIGYKKGDQIYNIAPTDQQAPNGGYKKEYILKIKHVPDLFYTDSELKQLKRTKKELLTDENTTFTSQTRNNNIIERLAEKYKVDTQIIWDSIP